MPTVRIRNDDSSAGTTLATVLLGAVAGFAVGMYVAQRMGGLAGLTNRLRKRPAKDQAESFYEADGKDFPDTDEYEFDDEGDLESDEVGDEEDADAESREPRAESHLEERVLEAFNNDPVLAERAIDIGAIGAGEIELEGWVDDDREAEHAVTIARGVPGVRTVSNRLMVDAEG
jgi:hypothetical protein